MRIAIIGDSHFDEGPRFEECIRVHDWIANDIREREVDVVAHTGDLSDVAQTRRVRNAIADWLYKVAEQAPTILVRGNHDPYGDLSIFARLRTRHPVIVEESAAVHDVKGLGIACLAWPQKSRVAARARVLNPSAGKADVDELAGHAMRAVLQDLGDQLAAHKGPRLFLGHVMARGSRTSLGQPLVGMDAFEVGLDDLALVPADFYGLGHIHLPQEWLIEGRSAAFTGSPYRTTYGELEEKGYIIVDIDRPSPGEPRVVKWERVPTPCTGMVLAEITIESDGGFTFIPRGQEEVVGVEGAEVRLRYHVAADRRDVGKALVAQVRSTWLDAGAIDVKVEERVIATSTARIPEIATAATLDEKLDHYWKLRGQDLDAARRERLRARATELQAVAREAA